MPDPNPNPCDNDSNKRERPTSFEIEVGASAIQFFKQQQEIQAKWTSMPLGLHASKEILALAETVRKIQDSMPKVDPRLAEFLANRAAWTHAVRISPEFRDTMSRMKEMSRIYSNSGGKADTIAMNNRLMKAVASASTFAAKATKALGNRTFADQWPSMESFEDEEEKFLVANIDLAELLEDPDKPSSSFIVEESSRVKRIITDIYADDKTLLTLGPHNFEEVVAELLRSQGFSVDLTKRTRDGGYDLIAISSHAGFPLRFLVECKRYTNKKIGIEIIRSLMYVVEQEKANKGIIVTTSYFSKDAQNARKNTHPFLLDLKDKTDVLSWIHQYGESILHLRRPAK